MYAKKARMHACIPDTFETAAPDEMACSTIFTRSTRSAKVLHRPARGGSFDDSAIAAVASAAFAAAIASGDTIAAVVGDDDAVANAVGVDDDVAMVTVPAAPGTDDANTATRRLLPAGCLISGNAF